VAESAQHVERCALLIPSWPRPHITRSERSRSDPSLRNIGTRLCPRFKLPIHDKRHGTIPNDHKTTEHQAKRNLLCCSGFPHSQGELFGGDAGNRTRVAPCRRVTSCREKPTTSTLIDLVLVAVVPPHTNWLQPFGLQLGCSPYTPASPGELTGQAPDCGAATALAPLSQLPVGSSGMENGWSSSDTIALVSGIVAGLSVIVAGTAIAVNAWLTNRRMVHDERMQTQRLAHERREALTTTAAEGYAAASKLLQVIHPDAQIPIAERRIAAENEARQPLDVIVAVGWSPEVRVAAMSLVAAVAALAAKSFAMSGLLESDSDPPAVGRAEAQLQATWEDASTAMAEYQMAISEEEA